MQLKTSTVKWHGILSNQPVEIEIIDIDDEGLIGK